MPQTSVDKKVVDKEKAIAIANDVLDRIDHRRIRRGTYGSGEMKIKGAKFNKDTQLQELVPDLEKFCDTCLLGTCLLSKAKLYDELTLGQFVPQSDFVFCTEMDPIADISLNLSIWHEAMEIGLAEILGPFEMDKLESWFEQRMMANDLSIYTEAEIDILRGCVVAGSAYHDPKESAFAALKNFIENGACLTVKPISSWDYSDDDDEDSDLDDGDEDWEDEFDDEEDEDDDDSDLDDE